MNAVIDAKTACTRYKKMLDITVQYRYLEMLWPTQMNTDSTLKDLPVRLSFRLLQQGAYMQAASLNTSPNTAQCHSGLALELIVIFFCVSPSLNEKTGFCEAMHATVFLMLLCSLCYCVPHATVFLMLLCSLCYCVPHATVFLMLLCSLCYCVPHATVFLMLLCSSCCCVPPTLRIVQFYIRTGTSQIRKLVRPVQCKHRSMWISDMV